MPSAAPGGESYLLYYLLELRYIGALPVKVCPYTPWPGQDHTCPGIKAARLSNPLRFEVAHMSTEYEIESAKVRPRHQTYARAPCLRRARFAIVSPWLRTMTAVISWRGRNLHLHTSAVVPQIELHMLAADADATNYVDLRLPAAFHRLL